MIDDLRDVPILGKFVFLGGSLLDLIANSGELFFLAVDFLLSNVELVATILRTLESLAKRIPFLPVGIFDDALTAALVALLVVEILRFGEAALTKS